MSLAKVDNAVLGEAIRQIKRGQHASLEVIYHSMKEPIYVLALSILHNAQLAEDVSQETLIHIVDKVETYHEQGRAKAWILSITRNLALDVIRQSKKIQLVEELQDNHTTDSIYYGNSIEEALKSLESLDRQIVIFRIIAGLSHKDIASVLGITSENSRVRYNRALKKLKIYYEK